MAFFLAALLSVSSFVPAAHAGDPSAPGACDASLRDSLLSWVPEHLLHAIGMLSRANGVSSREFVEKVRLAGFGLDSSYLLNHAEELAIHFEPKNKSPESPPIGGDEISDWASKNPQQPDEELPTYLTRMAVALALSKNPTETHVATAAAAQKIIERLLENGSIDRLFLELIAHHPQEWDDLRSNVCGLPRSQKMSSASPDLRSELQAMHQTMQQVLGRARSASASLNALFLYAAATFILSRCGH